MGQSARTVCMEQTIDEETVSHTREKNTSKENHSILAKFQSGKPDHCANFSHSHMSSESTATTESATTAAARTMACKVMDMYVLCAFSNIYRYKKTLYNRRCICNILLCQNLWLCDESTQSIFKRNL